LLELIYNSIILVSNYNYKNTTKFGKKEKIKLPLRRGLGYRRRRERRGWSGA
jgi:hypothetical protein